MSIKSFEANKMNTWRRKAAAFSGLGFLVILAGCQHDPLSAGGHPLTFRERHPIVVSEAPTVLDLPAGNHHTHLTTGMRSAIHGFAVDYYRSGAKGIDVLVPSGSSNEDAAAHIAKSAKSELVKAGISKKQIAILPYQARVEGKPGNVRLAFHSIKAKVASECGVWPTDISQQRDNGNYENFGCASQSNLAAIIADPNDLIAPRGPGDINAERSAVIVGDFESNEAPALTIVPASGL